MSDTSRTEIRDWFNDLINIVRKKEKKGVLKYDLSLDDPCQVEVFCVESPIKGQIYVVTNDQDRPDKEILIHEFSEASNFIEGVENVTQSKHWQQSESPPRHGFQEDTTSSRADLLADALSKFIEKIEDAIFSDVKKERLQLSHHDLWSGGKYNIVVGNITRFDVEETVKPYCRSAIAGNGSNNQTNKHYSNEKSTLGGIIYEPVWVGELPELSFENKVQGVNSISPEQILKTNVFDADIHIFENGLILFDGVDAETSRNILNVIFGIGLFHGHRDWKSISPREIVSAGLNGGDLTSVGFEKSAPSERNQEIYPENPQYSNRERIEKDILERLIKIVKVIYPIHNLRDMVTLHLQAHTHFLDDKLRSSFVLNWVVVEQLIEALLTDRIKEEYELDWENNELEYAAVTNLITHSEYNLLDSHRVKRNKVIHDMESVSKVDAMELDILVSGLVVRKINKYLNKQNIEIIDGDQLAGELRPTSE